MSTHVHFDEAAIAAATDRRIAEKADLQKHDTSEGAQARINADVLKAYTLAIVREVNRGTCGQFLHEAVCAVLANIVISYALSVTNDASIDMKVTVINDVLIRLNNNIAYALDHPGGEDMFQPLQGGHA